MTFGGLDALFNPAKQHMEEEKLRLQSTREDIGDASGGKRIDLDSGRVRLSQRRADGDSTESDSSGEGSSDEQSNDARSDDEVISAATDGAAKAESGRRAKKEPGKDESAATQRARERRRKTS